MKFLKYGFVLVKNIYSNSVSMLWAICRTRGALATETVPCRLKTKSSFYQMLICIGITLTPGTLVSKKEGNYIEVLKQCNRDQEPHLIFDRIFQEGGS